MTDEPLDRIDALELALTQLADAVESMAGVVATGFTRKHLEPVLDRSKPPGGSLAPAIRCRSRRGGPTIRAVGQPSAWDNSRDYSREEIAAMFRTKQAEWKWALAEADGDERAAGLILSRRRLADAERAVPLWHPERVEYVPGIPPWHPENGGEGDMPPEGGVREPRRPSPNSPSDVAALEEPTSE